MAAITSGGRAATRPPIQIATVSIGQLVGPSIFDDNLVSDAAEYRPRGPATEEVTVAEADGISVVEERAVRRGGRTSPGKPLWKKALVVGGLGLLGYGLYTVVRG